MTKIKIFLDTNERGTDRAVALARVAGADPAFELAGFDELPVDLKFVLRSEDPIGCGLANISDKTVLVELKEIPDFWASKASGHLGQQLLSLVSEGQPGFVAVFGSLQETLEQVPRVTISNSKLTRRTQTEIAQDVNIARAICADAIACNVPIHFLSSNQEQSFRWIASYAKNVLTGPNLASWLPRFGVDAISYGMLCSIPGIGDSSARAILQAVPTISDVVALSEQDLAEIKVNEKRLGLVKAAKIRKAFG
jgi:ERCC4-type nuclease